MIDAKITITTSQRIDDKTGRTIVRYTPTLKPNATASGSLSFACYERWADESPFEHESAQRDAIQSAIESLTLILKEASHV